MINRPQQHHEERRFYGKYLGIVSDINDPKFEHRIRARVEAVLGTQESGWARPCLPFIGDGMGLYVLPKVGALVWMEFENGDPDYPIWGGGFPGSAADTPAALATPPYKKTLLKTEAGHSILIDDTPGSGGITLETATGQKIIMNANGIEINNGLGSVIKMTGPKVDVNNGGLEVM